MYLSASAVAVFTWGAISSARTLPLTGKSGYERWKSHWRSDNAERFSG